MVECLVNDGADVNDDDDKGKTPLYIALEKGHLSIVVYLINHGAVVNKATGWPNIGKTPLSIAEENGFTDIAELLKAHGGK